MGRRGSEEGRHGSHGEAVEVVQLAPLPWGHDVRDHDYGAQVVGHRPSRMAHHLVRQADGRVACVSGTWDRRLCMAGAMTGHRQGSQHHCSHHVRRGDR
jgi:hypothetical protein